MADIPTPNDKQPPSSSSSTPPAGGAIPPSTGDDPAKWGTHLMGHPAAPASHPDNKKAAALWKAEDSQQNENSHDQQQQPYLVFSPMDKPSGNPYQSMIHMFSSWSNKAETMARNVWHNLKTGPSVSETAWGKLNLTAKALTEGGFESLFKQIFETDPEEKLKKRFACYLSTTTGPVAGTLYLSTAKVAFCSDRPLSFKAPSGQETWSYYKVVIPLGNIANVNPVAMRENHPPEKYVQIVTVDGHEFWFMGFVNYEKASHHLLDSVSDFTAARSTNIPPQPPVNSASDYTTAHSGNIPPQPYTAAHSGNIPPQPPVNSASDYTTAPSGNIPPPPYTATHSGNIPPPYTTAPSENIPPPYTSAHSENNPPQPPVNSASDYTTSPTGNIPPQPYTAAHSGNITPQPR